MGTRARSESGASGKTKVLLFDVESSPNIAYIWAKYEQNALGDFIRERQVISFAWKWLGEKTAQALTLPMFARYKKDPNDNRALIEKLHNLISQADVIVGHNIDNFDDKISNTEFLLHGLNPPPPHKTVDTLKIARSRFFFNSNKLDDLGKKLGFGGKVHTGGFSLWVGCLKGDPASWEKMRRYNIGDVILLEKIYKAFLPWIGNHPSVTVLPGVSGCRNCASKHLQARGWAFSNTTRYRRFQCKDCGKWNRGIVIRGEWQFR